MTSLNRKYDVVLWGATGFTGRLTGEYLSTNYPSIKVAIAGRSESKLKSIKKSMKLRDDIDILVADIKDSSQLDAMISQTSVVISAAGPYAWIGTEIVDSCVRCATNYCDITGEIPWVKSMIDKHHDEAKSKGIKIVNSCGFDCVPADMCVYSLVKESKKQDIVPEEVRMSLVDFNGGGIGGGTVASLMNVIESNPSSELERLANPYYLTDALDDKSMPEAMVSANADDMSLGYDRHFKMWRAPWMMQAIDSRVVLRSNSLSGWNYGREFIFKEGVLSKSLLATSIVTGLMMFGALLIKFPVMRFLIKKMFPSRGDGPSKEACTTGSFKFGAWLRGRDSAGNKKMLFGYVDAPDGDGGYIQCAKMVSECAVALACDAEECPKSYGVITPSIAFGQRLVDRLGKRGLAISVTSDAPTK